MLQEFQVLPDERKVTPWIQSLTQTSFPLLLQTYLVNAAIPAHLTARLQGALKAATRTNVSQGRAFVINVTSPEGAFSLLYEKEDVHVHTNMAKAALNMLTKSLSTWTKENIYVNSVDPGWVSNLQPRGHLRAAPPLTMEQGAARILQPVRSGLLPKTQCLGGQHYVNFQSRPF